MTPLTVCHHTTYFSLLDLRSGYWQIEVDEQDREKTAFINLELFIRIQGAPIRLMFGASNLDAQLAFLPEAAVLLCVPG